MAPCAGWEPNLAVCPGVEEQADQGPVLLAKEIAADVLWALSGSRFGLCEVTIRPAATTGRNTGLAAQAYAYGGIGARYTGPPMSCSPAPRFITLAGPVHEVTEVVIDGDELDPDGYQLVGNKLFRIGADAWPSGQDLHAAPGQPGTWSITYTQGIPVSATANYAAGVLACEVWKALTNQACRLPKRVTDIAREGVSMTVLDPQEFLEKGRTGIAEIDMWLSAVNPTGQRAGSSVWSPDLPDHQRV